ncbi:hypothetical protein BG011_003748 [Mortierella polycephala]|uniref:Uncharacterized protein n=1 Tax=Mortierella polycephala TaxID=41804 RepID=A0A9P6Q079_9FUNG|nr:hypothetical protein BG011_003748 [Mortierella polycephala]
MESILEQPTANLLPSTKHLDRTSLNLLPCGIQHNGKANINQFFFLVDGQYVSETPEPGAAQASASSEPCTVIAETLEATTTSATTTATEAMASNENGTTTSITSVSTTTAIAGNAIRTDALPATSTPVLEVSFRGRTLKGTTISVPEGYMGSIYGPYDAAARHNNSNSNGMDMDMDMNDEDQEYEAMLKGMQEERKTMRTKAQFKEFMVWGHDEQPSVRNDKVVKAMQWIDIAKVLHEPLC